MSVIEFASKRLTSALLLAGLIATGCSVIATSAPEQCSTDGDCYAKFGGGYTCQTGGCVAAANAAPPRVIGKLDDCRSTQECVASLGEGWLCRRDRTDPQKLGKCQHLTSSAECRVLGAYKNDEAILLGAVLPGKGSPALQTAVRSGLERAIDDWEVATRNLQATNVGPDAVAPPRPFGIIACSEDVPQVDLRNLFLNAGVSLLIGPTAMRVETEKLSSELTTAKLPLISPTSLVPPKDGANVSTYFFRLAGNETALSTVVAAAAPLPTVLIRRSDSYEALANLLMSSVPMSVQTYDNPAAFVFAPPSADANVLVLGDGETADVLTKVATTGTVYVLPSAIPDLAARLAAPQSNLPAKIRSARAPRSTTVPAPAFGSATFGDAETYDALYMVLTAIAAIGDDKNPELVKQELLRAALLRVTDVAATKTFAANGASIRDLIKELRSAPADQKISLMGATGPLTLAAGDQAAVRTFQLCVVSKNGCN